MSIDCFIQPVDKEKGKEVRSYIDTLTKPPGSLGRLEELAIQLAEITSQSHPVVTPPGVIVFAADHGIVEEGVSAFPQEVTAQMVGNFANGGAAINVFSRQIGARLKIVDIGVANDVNFKAVVDRKIKYGTANFCTEDAMAREEAIRAIDVGFTEAEMMIREGIKCLIPGEMGIGNTTASSAILASLTGTDIALLVGSGTGIEDGKLAHKQDVIKRALQARKPDSKDPLDILSKVGGLEICGMAGAMLAAAENKIPILVDGFICTVAALLAVEMATEAKDYMIIGHESVEPGHQIAIERLGKKPLLHLEMRLGEGTGAAVAFPILLSAVNMLKMATFSSAGISTN
ncbi:nicotinate-nucleotide--dimethylbenzimidazole phosphoribosyltransferase [Fictibacillus sp. Mic-4]|uniref:nicotinate-nucleotide--dimethylbenzimidazole phosphoribosyltransferase n=1 Tax=Fictibacillus sp. Mic-4 TaxID=3132826 RepID=UPI003CE70EF1